MLGNVSAMPILRINPSRRKTKRTRKASIAPNLATRNGPIIMVAANPSARRSVFTGSTDHSDDRTANVSSSKRGRVQAITSRRREKLSRPIVAKLR
jgi:hypothetical protein